MPGFKIGDRIIIKEGETRNHAKAGWIGTIVEKGRSGNAWKIKYENATGTWKKSLASVFDYRMEHYDGEFPEELSKMEISKMGGTTQGVWKSQDGRETKYEEMNTTHLVNAVKKLERTAEEKKVKLQMLLEGDIKELEIPEITIVLKSHPLMTAKSLAEYCDSVNMHYTPMKEALKEKQAKEKAEAEEKERKKELPKADVNGWF